MRIEINLTPSALAAQAARTGRSPKFVARMPAGQHEHMEAADLWDAAITILARASSSGDDLDRSAHEAAGLILAAWQRAEENGRWGGDPYDALDRLSAAVDACIAASSDIPPPDMLLALKRGAAASSQMRDARHAQ